ncbi:MULTISPECIES: PepSY domain-containing protein [unclassified Paraburkholderia]|uniref:PepSY-associated TM helix domain-containing protein n=1 Tax=unclassified Paraburkholderia TaxID=2615204 RepID=UPI0016204A19|nr:MULTISPECIES: PepSY domain-containing protein [unclassified Paraburkholderia]MBB5443961.1 putative iron-regulated membrane protein [Paraburkholderia sp. WSM4177]MBB5485551.1 putative iron-regulated membrane protein [Paraburkholderia sp. WSM4180]
MSTTQTAERVRAQNGTTAATSGPTHPGYRTLWRWHFYAGLFVMPFLLVLAITGTLYCFQPQIEPLLYRQQLVVAPQAVPRLADNALLAKARAAMPPGSIATTAVITRDPQRSAEFVFRLADGSQQSIYLNPYSGDVLGTLSVEHRLMQMDRMLHRKLLLGKPGELLMELAACWTLVMIGTGVALWWPRGKTTARAVLLPRLALKGRPLWKSLHAVIGIWLALGALAFVLTGLPWTGSWGKQFKSFATATKLGAPPGAWGGLPLRSIVPGTPSDHPDHASATVAHATHADMDSMPGMVMDDLPLPLTPWAAGNSSVPSSAATDAAQPLSLGHIVALAASLGIADGYRIVLPNSAAGVYTLSWFPANPKDERTLYVDQYSGAILKDIRYGDYGAIAKAVSYGTSLHMGRYFGVANQILCAAISLGLGALAVTGFVMWWKRRPQRSLGAPSRERAAPPMRGWATGLALLGVVFPLMGATLVAVWLLDRLVFGRDSRPEPHGVA